MSRDEALQAGRKRYFTGLPCRRGHLAERYTSMGGCVECVNRRTPFSVATTHLPMRPMFFSNAATASEAQAAFRFMEINRWHDQAVQAVRADPALKLQLLAQYTGVQRLGMEAADRARATKQRKYDEFLAQAPEIAAQVEASKLAQKSDV